MEGYTISKSRRRTYGVGEAIVFIIIVIAYLVFLIHTIQFAFLKFDDCTEETKGTVTEIWNPLDGNGRYYPTFEITVDGKTYDHRQYFASRRGEWKEGDQVEIKYNPENPSKMYSKEEIDSHKSALKGRLLAALIFGLMLLRLGYLIFR